MKLRKTYITEDETITTTGTVIHDLDFTDPLRELQIGFYGKRYDHTDTNDPLILRDIDKIEIVDGTDVIYSTDGMNAGANQYYHTGKMPLLATTANSYSTNRAQIRLLFGRDVSDNNYCLDLNRFVNPQLKITHSFTEGSTGQWAAGKQTHSIAAIVAENAPKPRGFFMTKEIYSWSKASSGDETIDLPRDYPYRYIIMQILDAETPTFAEISKTKISCDYDTFVPVNETTEDMAWENASRFGFVDHQYEAIGDGSNTDIKAYNNMTWNWGCDVSSWNTGQDAHEKRPYSWYSTLGRHTCPDSSGADFTDTYLESGQRAICTFRGYEPFGSQIIPFGNMMDQEEWFNPREYKSVRLILTQAQTASKTSKIVAQQVRPY